ncbi:MAG: 2OG-Fe(II) oxygenase [Drouetiella hepatica Uher 2000/2452]|uniref:2OG-Fe(II) oxygenase n=1 Tax=Drouetiella hepatica Uher 2000/2452 TaxID=904376 RepID=A0A951Q969_9CYAN|nr:2OG-Fe(II) oxygenase [Drouetiella hepatica Uher 2000/2452]
MQSQAEIVSLRQGEAVIFAVSHRPVRGDRLATKLIQSALLES